MNNRQKLFILLFFTGSITISCAPPYTMEPPDSFKRFEQINTFQFITADGVMLKGREAPNEPVADLDFWQDALKRHLEANGYVLKSEKLFKTKKNLDGCNLAFLIPYGAEDWMFMVTLFVEDDSVYILEAAGPFDRYTKIEKELVASLETFDPEGKE